MDVSCLNMRSQMARLNLRITPPTVELTIEDPKVTMETSPATLDIHRTNSTLKIDQSNFREALGMKSMNKVASEVAQKGSQAASAYIAAVQQEGLMMEDPDSHGTASAEFSHQHTMDPWPEVELALVKPAEITYTPGELSIKAKRGDLDIKLQRGSVDVRLNKGSVRGYVDPKQSLDMWVTKNKYDIFK